MGVIRVCCHGCLDDVLRLAVRAAGHAGGGVLDVDIVDGIAATHGDDEPGGIVGRIENVAAVEIASCYRYCVGFRVEGVVVAVEVEELEGRRGVQMLALVTQEGGQNGEEKDSEDFRKRSGTIGWILICLPLRCPRYHRKELWPRTYLWFHLRWFLPWRKHEHSRPRRNRWTSPIGKGNSR